MTPEEMTLLAFKFSERFEEIYTEYLIKMGEHLKTIGKLTPSDVHRLEQMRRFGANIKDINKKIAQAASITEKELQKVYESMVADEYKYASFLYAYAKVTQVALSENTELQTMLEAMKRVTHGTFENLSNTTALSEAYKTAVDKAIIAVNTGVSTYDKELRHIINNALTGGRIVYSSGYKRRLDSAARMNVLEGIRQVNIQTRNIMGEQFGADGVEISAHALCAPDHMDIQGKQFNKREFEELNAGLKRQIGTLNCKHYITPIILAVSKPAYTKKELSELRELSEKKIDVDGSTYTRYECTQLMRNLETETRYAKEKSILCKAAGDVKGDKQARQRIKELRVKYNQICEKADLAQRPERMRVPNFR